MISQISAKKQKTTTVITDPLFVLAELLIKIDKREKVIEKEANDDEDKRSSDNTSQAE
jgi:hypothetical protein